MVAIDNVQDIPETPVAETAHAGQIVLFTLLGASLAAIYGLATADTGTGWPVAADMVSRFSVVVFVALMVVEPLGRLIPSRFTRALARERASLVLGFVAATVVSLFCVVAPWLLVGEQLGAPTIAYCALTAMILVAFLFSGHPATLRLLGAPAWRAMQRIATAFFWMAFALTALSRIVGPHRPDDWHGFALILLVAAVLLRFADAFAAHWRLGRLAGKVA